MVSVNPITPALASTAEYFIGRQPILDTEEATYAYELLFRSGLQNCAKVLDGRAATESVFNCVLNVMGLSTLVGKSRAFINVTEGLLLNSTYSILPQDRVVVELLEDIRPTAQVVKACKKLKSRGYFLALDDFVDRDDYHELLVLADIVKVDFMGVGPDEREVLTQQLRQYPARLLAEKVETCADIEQARSLGYSYFQGYYYQKPVVFQSHGLSANKNSCLRLLQAINADPFDIQQIELVIKRDPALATKLLCYINSAYFGLRTPVESIGHGVKLLGIKQVRKWGSLIAVEGLREGHPVELTRDCLARGLFCEALEKLLPIPVNALDLFMTGLLSLVDTLTGQSKHQIIEQLDLKPEIAAALLGENCSLGDVLRLAEACEKCDHDRVLQYADRLQISPDKIAEQQNYAIREALKLSV